MLGLPIASSQVAHDLVLSYYWRCSPRSFVILMIYFDAQVVPDLATRIPWELASVPAHFPAGHAPIILGAF